MRGRTGTARAAVAAMAFAALPLLAAAPALVGRIGFTAAQVAAGKSIYAQRCASCHGPALNDGEFAPALKGDAVLQQWSGGTLAALFATVHERMPPTDPGSLTPAESASVLAYILQENGFEAGTAPLSDDPAVLAAIPVPPPTNPLAGALSDDVTIPPPPEPRRDPLRDLGSVTEAMLAHPADGDWLTWRRTPEVDGFSPLGQVTRGNVGDLRLAWAWSLPSGPNESTPLVHDGVMFVFGQGRDDVVQALDAATGDQLWQYVHALPRGEEINNKKSLALLGTRLFFATSDRRLVALDARTGAKLWEQEVLPPSRPELRTSIVGGPLAAAGTIVVGTTGQQPGGNFIVGYDPANGHERWRFATIARPGTPGGNSWNGLPLEKCSGGSVWNPGSYDPRTGLVFFGPAPTYDTGPLRDRSRDPAVNNDALYTNNTVALDPATGRLRWHFAHRPNDQWDLDWAYERQIVDLTVAGKTRRVIVTGGKEAIFDLLDAGTGAYLRSFDLGLQNIVTAIDPKTGRKQIDPARVPTSQHPVMVCPHAEGGKNWLPDAVDPRSGTLFVPLVEACTDLIPAGPGGGGLLTTGVKARLRPRPDSDGKFGRLEAVDLRTGKPVWTSRRRAPSTSGVLATAGGLVFAGYMDRSLIAFNSASGEELWQTRLGGMPSSTIISYAARGRQYLAVITSNGGHHAATFSRLVPEIRNPANQASTVWVFALPTPAP